MRLIRVLGKFGYLRGREELKGWTTCSSILEIGTRRTEGSALSKPSQGFVTRS